MQRLKDKLCKTVSPALLVHPRLCYIFASLFHFSLFFLVMQLDSCPVELLRHHILISLSWPQLVMCSMVNSKFHKLSVKLYPKLNHLILTRPRQQLMRELFSEGSVPTILYFKKFLRYPVFSCQAELLRGCVLLAAEGALPATSLFQSIL